MGQGAATAIHPKAEEHPQAYQPATQPRADEEKSSLVGQRCRRDEGGQSRIPTPASY